MPMRRFLSFALCLLLLTGLLHVPVSARAEGYLPLPQLLLFEQENVQKDLGYQRKENRTYPKTGNEAVNQAVSAEVDRLAEETLARLPAFGGDVMTWADTGASVTVTGTKTASFLILSHIIDRHEQTCVSFAAMSFDLETGSPLTMDDLFTREADRIVRAAVRTQLGAYFPKVKADAGKLDALCDSWREAPFTLSPAYLILHYRADALYPNTVTLMHVKVPYSWLNGCMTDYALAETDNSRYLLAAPTFDDGPSRGVTASVLFTLRKYCAGATFFNNGPQMAKCHDYIQWEHDAGYAVESHTWSHTVGLRDRDQMFWEKDKLEELQVSLIGLVPSCMRSPGGVDGDYVRAKIGLPIIRWNSNTYDAVSDYTLSRSRGVLLSTLTDTAVVLSHNLATHSGQNCEQLLSILRERGYMTVTTDELFRIRRIELKPDTVYTGDETGAPGWEQAELQNALRLHEPDAAPTTEPAETPAATAAPVPTAEPAPTLEPLPPPTAEPAPTTEPLPTVEPAPTFAPVPTAEPAPTATPEPTASPAPFDEPLIVGYPVPDHYE